MDSTVSVRIRSRDHPNGAATGLPSGTDEPLSGEWKGQSEATVRLALQLAGTTRSQKIGQLINTVRTIESHARVS